MVVNGSNWLAKTGIARSVWDGMHFERIDVRRFAFEDTEWVFLIDFKLEQAGIINFKRIINPNARYTKASARWIYVFDDDTDLAMFFVYFGGYISQMTYNSEKKYAGRKSKK